ncbi:MAG: hypothetical protein PHC75_06875 [Burkholderiales bacterium]|nr:hypothetical protein [Burkholderiales bacterium]
MKKIFIALLGASASAMLISCNSGGVNSSSMSNSNSLKDANFITRMGAGVDSTTNTVVSSQSCLIAMQNKELPYTISNPQTLIDFSKSSDLSILEKSLNVDVSGKYGGDRFSVSAAASFANASKDNKYATNIIYLYKYAGVATFKDGVLGESANALTTVAKELISYGDKTEFEQMCGDKFISQMDAGVVLAVKLTLKFNSHNDQQKMEAELKGSYGVASVAAAIRHASSSQKIHSELTLSAFQQGGEPHKLNDIFGKRANVSGNYPVLDCGDPTKDSNSCNQMIDAIIDYAQTMKEQISPNGSQIDMSKLYYSNTVAQPWSSIQVRPYLLHPSAELLNTMEKITTDYDNTVANYNFAKHYLFALNGKLSATTVRILDRVVDKLGKQINEVYNAPVYHVMSCYRGYVTNECLNIKKNIDNALEQDKYKLDPLSIQTLSYLRDGAYGVELYGLINKTDNPVLSDYDLIGSCFMAPISNKVQNKYALNCDGNWLNVAKQDPLIAYQDPDKGQFVIQNLAYQFIINPFDDQKFGRNFLYANGENLKIEIPYDMDLEGIYAINNLKIYSSKLNLIDMLTARPNELISSSNRIEVINLLENPS